MFINIRVLRLRSTDYKSSLKVSRNITVFIYANDFCCFLCIWWLLKLKTGGQTIYRKPYPKVTYVGTGSDKFLHGQKLARFHLAFIWDRRNWTEKSRSQTCTLSRSKIRPVPPISYKSKVEPCKFLCVQNFVRTRVNGASNPILSSPELA